MISANVGWHGGGGSLTETYLEQGNLSPGIGIVPSSLHDHVFVLFFIGFPFHVRTDM